MASLTPVPHLESLLQFSTWKPIQGSQDRKHPETGELELYWVLLMRGSRAQNPMGKNRDLEPSAWSDPAWPPHGGGVGAGTTSPCLPYPMCEMETLQCIGQGHPNGCTGNYWDSACMGKCHQSEVCVYHHHHLITISIITTIITITTSITS